MFQPPLSKDNLPTLEDIQEAYEATGLKPAYRVNIQVSDGAFQGMVCPVMALYLQAHPHRLGELEGQVIEPVRLGLMYSSRGWVTDDWPALSAFVSGWDAGVRPDRTETSVGRVYLHAATLSEQISGSAAI